MNTKYQINPFSTSPTTWSNTFKGLGSNKYKLTKRLRNMRKNCSIKEKSGEKMNKIFHHQ